MDQKERNEIRNLRIGEAIARQHIIAAARVKNTDIRFSDIRSSALRELILSALKRPGVAPNTRPRSRDGATAFHFKISSVRNSSMELSRIAGKSTKGFAEAHARYIEREGAAEVVRKNKGDRSEGREMQEYIERDGAAEEVGEELASFGTISPNYKERLEFWQQVEETERKPQKHKIKFFPAHSEEFWRRVQADGNAPPEFRKAANGELTQFVADEATIKHLIEYAKEKGGFKGRRKAVSYEPGRGGRIQTRMILELPHEITPQERLNLAKEFCLVFEQRRLPYWAVIHAPDHHNDSRNNHLHIAFSERPARKMVHPQTGEEVWDFTIVELKKFNDRHTREVRPYRQPKDRDVHGKDWIAKQRRRFSKLMNEYLMCAGVDRTTDPRTYKDMGIDAVPIQRLSPTEYNFEKRGIDTPNGEATVKAQWERRQKELEREYDKSCLDQHLLQRWKKALNGTRRSDLGMRLQMAYFAWKENVGWKHALETNIAAADYVLQKIESKTLPPLKEKTPYEKEAELFSKLWRETQIQPYTDAIVKTQIVQKKSLSLLSYAEQKIASGDLTDHKWNEHMRKQHEQMAQLVQSLSMLNTFQKWEQFFAMVAEDRAKNNPNPRPNQPPTYRPKSPDEILNVVKKLPSDVPEINTPPKTPLSELIEADKQQTNNQRDIANVEKPVSAPAPETSMAPAPVYNRERPATKYVRVHVSEEEIFETIERLKEEQRKRNEERKERYKREYAGMGSHSIEELLPRTSSPASSSEPRPAASKSVEPDVRQTELAKKPPERAPVIHSAKMETAGQKKLPEAPRLVSKPVLSPMMPKEGETVGRVRPNPPSEEKPEPKKPVMPPVDENNHIREAELRRRVMLAQKNKKKKKDGWER
jgi:MobA/MobL family